MKHHDFGVTDCPPASAAAPARRMSNSPVAATARLSRFLRWIVYASSFSLIEEWFQVRQSIPLRWVARLDCLWQFRSLEHKKPIRIRPCRPNRLPHQDRSQPAPPYFARGVPRPAACDGTGVFWAATGTCEPPRVYKYAPARAHHRCRTTAVRVRDCFFNRARSISLTVTRFITS